MWARPGVHPWAARVGRGAIAAGDPAEAIGHLRAALADANPGTDADLVRLDLAHALLRTGEAERAGELVDAVLKADHALPWLAAQPVAAAVAIARGDSATAVGIIDRAVAEYAGRGFAWPHATAMLDDVRSSLVDGRS